MGKKPPTKPEPSKCPPHYFQCVRTVKKGKDTWEFLVCAKCSAPDLIITRGR